MDGSSEILSTYIDFDQHGGVPLELIADFSDAIGKLLSEYATEYVSITDPEWKFSKIEVGSLRTAIISDIPAPQLRIVSRQFIEDAGRIERGDAPVDVLPGRAIEPWGKVVNLFRRGVRSIDFGTDELAVQLTPDGAGQVAPKPMPRRSLSTIRGRVMGISFAGPRPFLSLRRDRPGRILRCFFSEDLADDVIALLRQEVVVSGYLYRASDGVIQRLDLERAPVVVQDRQIPVDIGALVGIAPDMTDGLPSEEWLRRQRSADKR